MIFFFFLKYGITFQLDIVYCKMELLEEYRIVLRALREDRIVFMNE